MELYTAPPPGSTVICADELGPVIPRTFPPAPGWSPGGHRIKAPLEYSRGPEKTWVYGGLRIADGQEITCTAARRLLLAARRRSRRIFDVLFLGTPTASAPSSA